MFKKLICFLLCHQKNYIARVHFHRLHPGEYDPPQNWDDRATHLTYKCKRCEKIDNKIVSGFIELKDFNSIHS